MNIARPCSNAWPRLTHPTPSTNSRMGADDPPSRHVVTNISMEYRRLLLRLASPEIDIPAPPLLDSY
jgi:hypothetical protein